MSYLSSKELSSYGFKKLGKRVLVSDKVSIYNTNEIEIGDDSRIDDFCVVSGKIKIGKNVHITPGCLVAGGTEGIVFEDFTTLAYHVQVFTQSDDYSGETMTNSTVDVKYKNECKKPVWIQKHSIVGAGSVVMPGVTLAEGTSIGAMSLVLKSTLPWGIYVGMPVKRVKNRSRNLLSLEKLFKEESLP